LPRSCSCCTVTSRDHGDRRAVLNRSAGHSELHVDVSLKVVKTSLVRDEKDLAVGTVRKVADYQAVHILLGGNREVSRRILAVGTIRVDRRQRNCICSLGNEVARAESDATCIVCRHLIWVIVQNPLLIVSDDHILVAAEESSIARGTSSVCRSEKIAVITGNKLEGSLYIDDSIELDTVSALLVCGKFKSIVSIACEF
jgi:hypothetical protein